MFQVLGSDKRLCNGLTRRDLLSVGGLSLLGVGMPSISQAAVSTESHSEITLPGFGRAKNVILLYLFGGPSHLETLDMKPQAPVEIRGQLRSIDSTLPGLHICEHLPNMARIMDRVTVVRSLNHPWNFHGMQYATTGAPEGSVPLEETLTHPMHQPYFGSVVNFYDHQRRGPKPVNSVPDNIVLPFLLSTRRPAARYTPPFASYLGSRFDPIWTEFRGEATGSMVRRSHGPATEIRDPYLGVQRDCRFLIAAEADMPGDVSIDRLNRRRSLLEQIETLRTRADRQAARGVLDQKRELAFSLLDSPAIRVAFDLDRESVATRDAYGMTLFGQSTLQARRLVEAGCKFVTVVWDEFGQLNAAWDTHVDHYNRLKGELLPGLDLAFSALMNDLESRGMLEDTLVLVMNEMGRTPRFEGDGRGHWGRAYTNFFAGAGIKRGNIVGKTDPIGATIADRPLTAKDILATIYHLIGINPHSTLPDHLGRPVPLTHDGSIVPEMLA
jgi:hypothetical protein